MKKLIFLILMVGYLGLALYPYNNVPEDAHAGTCFLTGSRTSGMNRICFYQCVGGTSAITISVTEICPVSIND